MIPNNGRTLGFNGKLRSECGRNGRNGRNERKEKKKRKNFVALVAQLPLTSFSCRTVLKYLAGKNKKENHENALQTEKSIETTPQATLGS